MIFVLSWKGVPEYLVDRIMPLYKDCKTTASVDRELSSSFSEKVGVHQGSALSSLLLTMVMKVLTEDGRDASLMELLYTDILVLCGGIIKRCFGQVSEMEICSGKKGCEGEC